MKVLHINTNSLNTDTLEEILVSNGHTICARSFPESKIPELVSRHKPDIIVADISTPDQHIFSQLEKSNRKNPCPVVMFSESDDSAVINAAVQSGVSAYVVDGMEPQRVNTIIEVALARFNETQSLLNDLNRTKEQLNERKYIERAKGILMQSRGWSEDEAYQLMRKQAMSKNKRVIDIAHAVIAAAELMG